MVTMARRAEMATNWTAEQRRAIETPGSLIVSAAAGSGKTAVLTERIARHILEGASPDDLLVVTFTRAAAAEMKKRIGDRLSALAAQQQATRPPGFTRRRRA